MEPAYQIKKFAEIRHLLPQDSWWIASRRPDDHFDQEHVVLFDGDAVVGNSCLDFTADNIFPADATPGTDISMILVIGNLRAGNIFNDETDGAISLMVLGHLEADNITVGGQEIYVAGNLTVHGLFWGDYNHGDLVVKGAINARVLMATEEYHVDWKRIQQQDNVNIAAFINDDDANMPGYPREVMGAVFEEDCLVDEADLEEDIYSFKYWLNTGEISRRLQEGLPVVRTEFATVAEAAIPFVFEGEFPSDANMERFRTSFLFSLFGSSESALKQLEYRRGDRYTRVTVQQDKPFSTNIYFQYLEEYAVMIFYFVFENTLRRAMMQRFLTGDDQEWRMLDLESPQPHFRDLAEQGWKALVNEFSAMEHYQLQMQEKLSVEKVKALLAQPVIKEKYSDYYDDNSDPLYIGSLMIECRQEDNERQACPRICIIKRVPHAEEGSEYAFFHIDLVKNSEGKEAVVLRTQDKDGYGSEVYDVSLTDTAKYKEALQYFTLLEKKITDITNNSRYA